MTIPAQKYPAFTYFEPNLGVYKQPDTLGQLGDFFTNTFLPLKDRVRLADKTHEVLPTHNWTINYLQQGFAHSCIPYLIRFAFFPEFQFTVKTAFAAGLASAAICTFIGIVCLQFSDSHEEAFTRYMKQISSKLSSEEISQWSAYSIAKYTPHEKYGDVVAHLEQKKLTYLFQSLENEEILFRNFVLKIFLQKVQKASCKEVALALLATKFLNNEGVVKALFDSKNEALIQQCIGLAPVESLVGRIDLIQLAKSKAGVFATTLFEKRSSDDVVELLGHLTEQEARHIYHQNIARLPFQAKSEEDIDIKKILKRIKDQPLEAKGIYRALAKMQDDETFVCKELQQVLTFMDAEQRRSFFESLNAKQASKAVDYLTQSQIMEMIPTNETASSPPESLCICLAQIEKANAQRAIQQMPDSYVEQLSEILSTKSETHIDIKDLITHVNKKEKATSKVLHNRSIDELDSLYVELGPTVFQQLIWTAPTEPKSKKIGIKDVVQKIGETNAVDELALMMKAEVLPTKQIVALLSLLPKEKIPAKEQWPINDRLIEDLIRSLRVVSSTHLCLCDLFTLDLSLPHRLYEEIAKRATKAEIDSLQQKLQEKFNLLLIYVDVGVEDERMDFLSVRKAIPNLKEIYSTFWAQDKKCFLQRLAYMPKADIQYLPVDELVEGDYENLVENLLGSSETNIDLEDCLGKLNPQMLAIAFLKIRARKDTGIFVKLFNTNLPKLAPYIERNNYKKIDAIEILTYKPENAKEFITAYVEENSSKKIEILIDLLPYAPQRSFDSEILKFSPKDIGKLVQRLFIKHTHWYSIAYIAKLVQDKQDALKAMIDTLNIIRIVHLQKAIVDEQSLSEKIERSYEEVNQKKCAQDFSEIGLSRTGICNASGSDCFLNSLMQAIVHTYFLEFFTDDRNLMNGNRNIFNAIQKIVEEYYHSATDKKPVAGLTNLRRLIAVSDPRLAVGHQDLGDAFQKLLDPFKGNDKMRAKGRYVRWMRLKRSTTVRTATLDDMRSYSQVDAQGKLVPAEEEPLMPFHVAIPEDRQALSESKKAECTISFQQAVAATFAKTDIKDKGTAIYNGNVITGEFREEKLEVSHMPENLAVCIKRFMNVGTGQYRDSQKLYNEVEVEELEQIGGKNYQLQSFVIHSGTTTGGHYTACCKTEGQWYYYNDGAKPDPISSKEALRKARDAYFLFFSEAKD